MPVASDVDYRAMVGMVRRNLGAPVDVLKTWHIFATMQRVTSGLMLDLDLAESDLTVLLTSDLLTPAVRDTEIGGASAPDLIEAVQYQVSPTDDPDHFLDLAIVSVKDLPAREAMGDRCCAFYGTGGLTHLVLSFDPADYPVNVQYLYKRASGYAQAMTERPGVGPYFAPMIEHEATVACASDLLNEPGLEGERFKVRLKFVDMKIGYHTGEAVRYRERFDRWRFESRGGAVTERDAFDKTEGEGRTMGVWLG